MFRMKNSTSDGRPVQLRLQCSAQLKSEAYNDRVHGSLKIYSIEKKESVTSLVAIDLVSIVLRSPYERRVFYFDRIASNEKEKN